MRSRASKRDQRGRISHRCAAIPHAIEARRLVRASTGRSVRKLTSHALFRPTLLVRRLHRSPDSRQIPAAGATPARDHPTMNRTRYFTLTALIAPALVAALAPADKVVFHPETG